MKKKSLLKSDPMKMRSKIGLCPLWVFSFKQSSVLNFKYFLVYLYINSLSFTYGATYFPIRTLSKFVSDFIFIFFHIYSSIFLAPSIPLSFHCKTFEKKWLMWANICFMFNAKIKIELLQARKSNPNIKDVNNTDSF